MLGEQFEEQERFAASSDPGDHLYGVRVLGLYQPGEVIVPSDDHCYSEYLLHVCYFRNRVAGGAIGYQPLA